MNRGTIFQAFALVSVFVVGACMETTTSEQVSSVPGTDARKAEPTCANAVAEKFGIPRKELHGANTQVTSTGVRVEVFRMGKRDPWICSVNKAGTVVSISS
ncbi:hypothetical protein [Marimonas lutisalis]|uniref:hypothetical protein n=1 Tax=Marimonas lutisalis TaxID=2545756 RepID=UPI0010F6CEDA|nr:hypothetical protein [Marimonas lutisalis]